MTKLESLTARKSGGKRFRRWTTLNAAGVERSWAEMRRAWTSVSVSGGGFEVEEREDVVERIRGEGGREREEVG